MLVSWLFARTCAHAQVLTPACGPCKSSKSAGLLSFSALLRSSSTQFPVILGGRLRSSRKNPLPSQLEAARFPRGPEHALMGLGAAQRRRRLWAKSGALASEPAKERVRGAICAQQLSTASRNRRCADCARPWNTPPLLCGPPAEPAALGPHVITDRALREAPSSPALCGLEKSSRAVPPSLCVPMDNAGLLGSPAPNDLQESRSTLVCG